MQDGQDNDGGCGTCKMDKPAESTTYMLGLELGLKGGSGLQIEEYYLECGLTLFYNPNPIHK